ncbi:unnamed protein product, partial [Oncorhynchus mykiss]
VFVVQLGWSIGPEHLIKHLQTVMQNTLYTCPTPLQEAVAQGLLRDYELMGRPECYFSSLAVELEGKRDRMAAILQDVGMSPIIPEGGYFMCVDVTPLTRNRVQQHVVDILRGGGGELLKLLLVSVTDSSQC